MHNFSQLRSNFLRYSSQWFQAGWNTGFVCNRELITLVLVHHKAVWGIMSASLINGTYCCCYCLQWHPVLLSKFLPIQNPFTSILDWITGKKKVSGNYLHGRSLTKWLALARSSGVRCPLGYTLKSKISFSVLVVSPCRLHTTVSWIPFQRIEEGSWGQEQEPRFDRWSVGSNARPKKRGEK